MLLARQISRRVHVHTQRLLLQEQEASVNQLKELGEVVELRKLA